MPRAWVIHDYSGYQGLSLEEFDSAEPGPGEVRLRVEAFALNWGDMDLMHDRYSFSFPEFPARIGMEATGIVDAVGAGVTNVEPGERVCTLPYFYGNQGTSAEEAIVDARYLTKAPEGLSAVECASVWMQYMTAYFPVVEISNAGPGTNFLVTAATGTAGSAAIEIGRSFGATMIGTTRYERNRAFLTDLGADHVIVTDGDDLAEKIMGATNGVGIHAAFDPVGGGLIGRYSKAFARNARIYFYGTLDETFPELPIVDMFQANAVFHPYSLFNYVEDEQMCAKGKAFVYDALASGKIKPRIDRVCPMEGYRDAFDYMRQPRETHGKIVVETGI